VIFWKESGMAKQISGHLSEEQIIGAIMDQNGLDGVIRDHLSECPVCRAKKEVLGGRLTRFGQLAREYTPLPLRRPQLASDRASAGPTWRLRPALGMGLVAALLVAVFLSPRFFPKTKETGLDKIYKEMAQDDQFMTEIEKLENNPLPRFYVDMSDPSDDGPDDTENDQPGRAG
jgi:hypothetical protein